MIIGSIGADGASDGNMESNAGDQKEGSSQSVFFRYKINFLSVPSGCNMNLLPARVFSSHYDPGVISRA